MNQNITINGFVATEPKYYEAKNGKNSDYINFRMASNKSHFDKKKNEWVDEKTMWFTVKAWNGLAKNIYSSIRKTDPILVTGNFTIDEWNDDSGESHTTLVIEASSVGHNLRFGKSTFTRNATGANSSTDSIENFLSSTLDDEKSCGDKEKKNNGKEKKVNKKAAESEKKNKKVIAAI